MRYNINEVLNEHFDELDFLIEVRVDEVHGVFPNYQDFMAMACVEVKKSKPKYLGDNCYMYSINYKPTTDEFINDIDIICYVYTDDKENLIKSEFKHSSERRMDLTDNGKLTNCKIIIRLVDKYGKIPESKFDYALIHELQHAYRYYKVLSNNNGDFDDNEKVRAERYKNNLIHNNATNMQLKSNQNSKILNIISLVTKELYEFDNDEINAFSAEIHEFIRQNPHINSTNYKQYIFECAVFSNLMDMSNIISTIDVLLNGDNPQICQLALSSVYDKFFGKDNKTNADKSRLIRQYLIRKLMRGYNQSFKVLYYALKDNNRFVEDTIVTLPTFRKRNVKMDDLMKIFDIKM